MSTTPTGNTYDKYATKNPIERRMLEGFLKALTASLPNDVPATVVEVGVGEGEISQRLRTRFPTATVVGVDLVDETLATHWRANGLACLYGDAGQLPFADDLADLVLAIEVLEHVPDPAAALREIARVARADVVLSVPREPIWRMLNLARGKYLRDLGNTPGHIQHWSTRSFTRLVEEHFDVIEVRRPLPWTLIQARARG